MNESPSSTSRESAFLDEMHDRAVRFIWGGVVAALLGAILLTTHAFAHAGVVLGFVGVLGGPLFVGLGLAWFRLLPAAREALRGTSRNVRLEVNVLKGGYGFSRFTNARLWSVDSDERVLAKFSESVHWQTPRLLSVDRVPARVFGLPVRGAAVVVSCEEGVVAGRIRRSRIKKSELTAGLSHL